MHHFPADSTAQGQVDSIICESSTSLLSAGPRGLWIVWARVESMRSLLGSSLNWDNICASSPLRCLVSTPTGLPPTLRAQVESTRLAFRSCRTWTPSAHHPPIYLFLPARQGRTGYRTVCLWLVCLATTSIAGQSLLLFPHIVLMPTPTKHGMAQRLPTRWASSFGLYSLRWYWHVKR